MYVQMCPGCCKGVCIDPKDQINFLSPARRRPASGLLPAASFHRNYRLRLKCYFLRPKSSSLIRFGETDIFTRFSQLAEVRLTVLQLLSPFKSGDTWRFC